MAFKKLKEIVPGVFNLRAPFKIAGILDIGTQMTFIRLATGKYVAFSTVVLDSDSKADVDTLTQNGELLEAVVATNAHHTLAFEAFNQYYPSAAFYGTPRHIRKFSSIPWKGDVSDKLVLTMWDSEIAMKNTDVGIVWDVPTVPEFNHFPGMLVYHRATKTMLVDDCYIVAENGGPLMKLALGGSIAFHPKFIEALSDEKDAPAKFYSWMSAFLDEWDVQNIATAHGGVKIGGAGAALRDALSKITRGKLGAVAKQRGAPISV
ncbi:hypothetical protein HDU84_003230 [Entophlyctis sp. JEL0112]|nr:hypothetical protein HDU84_003228 [Entophlyctis sp. JEL0112]KAJ3384031.1 hypothetical protein HDU84_003230 [Entophlyctis sp. JEL0112]